jgi:GMP synthase (glutamine-hydrolysing)
MRVWMSHGDHVVEPPEGFEILAETENAPVAVMGHEERAIYGIQFHPEVSHTPRGMELLENFATRICGCGRSWSMASFVEESIEEIRERVGDGRAVVGISGGVDSTVAGALVHRAIGERLAGVFVDTGLLRKDEARQVMHTLEVRLGMKVRCVDARERFLTALRGLTDPERKRKAIGEAFIRVFEAEAGQLGGIGMLVQGTLYPDVIESTAVKGPSAVIKSHHNVGGLPEKLGLEILEPLRWLFKDEVRRVGVELGLPEDVVHRHPFPGPGLAVRILGEVTEERIATLQEADHIFLGELRDAGLYRHVQQAFAVILPVQTVGVMGDERTYENVVALRSVNTKDFMTADWSRLPEEFLARVSSRIVNEVRGVNRVVYDITTKPPGTIEWE